MIATDTKAGAHTHTSPDYTTKPIKVPNASKIVPNDEVHLSGKELNLARKALFLSLKDAASFLGVTPRTIQRWEKMDEIPAGVAAVLQNLSKEKAQWISTVESADIVNIAEEGYRTICGRSVPESWWQIIVGIGVLKNPDLKIITRDD